MRRMVVWMAAVLLLATAAPPSATLSAEPANPPVTAPDAPARPAVDDILRQDLKELSGKVETNGLDIARLQAAASGQDTLRQNVKELSGKVETNGRDIARLESASGGQDQRLGDINNRIGDVNLWLAGFSALVTLLLAIAGVFTYFGAQEKARTAANAWIDGNAATLRQQLDELKAELEREAERHKDRWKAVDNEIVNRAGEILKKFDNVGNLVEHAASASPAEKEALTQADTTLTGKPEQDYSTDDWNLRAYAAASRPNWPEAAVYFAKAADSHGATNEQVARALFNKGVALRNCAHHDEAIAAYDEVLKRIDGASEPKLRILVATALVNKGAALEEHDRLDETIAAYDEVFKRFDGAPEPELREQVARALFNKGIALAKCDHLDEAIAAYDEVLKRFDGAPEPKLRILVATALVNKGAALAKRDCLDEAIAVYDEVLKRFDGAQEPELRKQVANALVNKGATLAKRDRLDEAIAAYDEALKRFDDAPEPELRKQVATALVNKGIAFAKRDRPDEAIATYDEVLKRFDGAPDPELRTPVATAVVNKGATLAKRGHLDEAIAAYDELLRRFPDPDEAGLRDMRTMVLAGTGWFYYQLRDAAQFLALTERALAAEPKLDYALANRAFALHLLGQPAAKVLAAYARARRVIPDPVRWRELAVEDLLKHAERWPGAAPIDAGLIAAVAAL